MNAPTAKPLALVVFLENVGHVGALNLPVWVRQSIDFLTEEYAKLQLRVLGAYRIYDQITILEDADATGPKLTEALTRAFMFADSSVAAVCRAQMASALSADTSP